MFVDVSGDREPGKSQAEGGARRARGTLGVSGGP